MIPLKYFKVYQYVQLGNRSMTFFSRDDATLKGIELMLNPDINVVEMKHKGAHICVPLNNVQYFEMEMDSSAKAPRKTNKLADA